MPKRLTYFRFIMNTELSPEALKIDMGEEVERFSVKTYNYIDNINKAIKVFGQIGFSCEDFKKLGRLFK